jgi:predicted helicase
VLAEQLSGSCDNIIKLYGTVSEKDRRLTLERLKAIPADQPILLIATGKYVGEGFDYPRLDTLFLAMPISWKGKVAQYAGRLHRNYPGKEEVLIYDYVDVHVCIVDFLCVEHESGCRILCPIEGVTDHRMTQSEGGGRMEAELVSAPRQGV